jgi:acetyl-CoA C-acetyltransferase
MVLTSQPTPIKVSGIGHATDTSAVSHRTSFTSFNSTKEAAHKAYAMAQLNPSDIQFAEVHDAFTPFEIIGTEDLGFFPGGEGWKALEEGITQLRGRLPINPSGGLKARGHPVGASGLAQLVEIVYQLRGEAGSERQLERAEIGLAHSIGGLGNNNLVTILERSDRKRILKTGAIPFQEGWNQEDQCEKSIPKKSIPSLSPTGVGTLETFTTLYTVPEGFRSPLTLGLVKTKEGPVVMACNPNYRSPNELKMGKTVSLITREGIYVFEKLTLWNRLKDWLKKQGHIPFLEK